MGDHPDLTIWPHWLSLSRVAVAQTLGEAAGSFLRVGSEIGHLIRHARCVRPEVARPSRSDGHLRDRAAAFPRWLYATATREGSTGRAINPTAGLDETQPSDVTLPSLLQIAVAVAQTRAEAAGSVLRPGSENGQVFPHARPAARDAGRLSLSGTHFRERGAPLPRRLYATATMESDRSDGPAFVNVPERHDRCAVPRRVLGSRSRRFSYSHELTSDA
jgi:hypothetical protein